jgi:hypothetical protein
MAAQSSSTMNIAAAKGASAWTLTLSQATHDEIGSLCAPWVTPVIPTKLRSGEGSNPKKQR